MTEKSDTEVYVVTDQGDILEAETYTTQVIKDSIQIRNDLARAGHWQDPRVSFEDLLYFFDVNVWHRRCVLIKALLVGGLGWRIEVKGKVIYDEAKGVNEQPNHPVVRLLTQPNPNPLEPFDMIVYRLLVDLYAMGNGYLEVVRDRKGQVAELYHAPGRTMRRDGRLDAYWQVKQGRQVAFDSFGKGSGRNEILHLYQYDPSNDYYGLPDWYAALGLMSLDRAVTEFNTRLFSNSLMAHMAIVVEGGKLSAAARTAIKSFVQERGIGVANAGRVLLLEDERDRVKVRFEKLNLDTKDLLVVDAQRQHRDAVIAAHGIPPRFLGIMQAGQLGATGEVEGQLRTFRETVLRPGRRLLETAFGVLIRTIDPETSLRFTEMDVTDMKADVDFVARMIEKGVYTPAEVRAMLDAR